MFDPMDFDYPKNTTVVILCCNKGYGLEPIKLCLPHQIYAKDLRHYRKEDPSIRSFTLIPANSKDYINIEEAE